jgi:hypothetical protein
VPVLRPPVYARRDRRLEAALTLEKKPTALVATPAARDRAIALLQEHYAKNHLETEQLERLVERAEHATRDDELLALFDGLPNLELIEPYKPATPGRLSAQVKATLGTTSRRGAWRVPSLLRVAALFGSVELDLCDAELGPGETILEVKATFGSVEITVPEGLAVDCEGAALLGNFDHLDVVSASQRAGRRLKIVGRAFCGTVDVVVKRRSTGALQQIGDGIRALLTGRS